MDAVRVARNRIAIIIPTIDGRHKEFARCVRSYRETCPDCELVPVHNKPTCGVAWNEGLRRLRDDVTHVHITADDIVARLGWWEAALRYTSLGVSPCPRILNTDGSIQSCDTYGTERNEGEPATITRIPFLRRDWVPYVYPVIETHYYTDCDVSDSLRAHNVPINVARDYLFVHDTSPIGRLTPSDEERRIYENARHRR